MHPMSRPEPPVPRSQQMRNAAAAAAAGGMPTPVPPPRSVGQSPTAFAGDDDYVMTTPTVATRGGSFIGERRNNNNNSSIDYNKYKTKLCRNYLLGQPCPFESRCVFAHGEDQLSRADSGSFEPRMPHSSTSQFGGSMEFPQTQAYPEGGYAAQNTSGSDDETVPSCPPTYEAFLATHVMEPASPLESEPASPVSPIRYRHDPYHPDGYVLKFY